jgi:hypothetical protein
MSQFIKNQTRFFLTGNSNGKNKDWKLNLFDVTLRYHVGPKQEIINEIILTVKLEITFLKILCETGNYHLWRFSSNYVKPFKTCSKILNSYEKVVWVQTVTVTTF